MVKKLLTLTFGLMLSMASMAQYGASNPTVPQSDILFWTGSGNNRAVVAITWPTDDGDNIGVAWGVQWNGSNLLMRDIMDTIAAYDSRLVITWNSTHSYINDLSYVDAVRGLNLTGIYDDTYEMSWWFYHWKDTQADTNKFSGGVMADFVVNTDFVDWICMDPDDYSSAPADTMIMADDPNAGPMPEEATIAANDILYWVGEGSNQAVLAVNWADTALAWGYRYEGSKTVSDMLNDIAAADPRFSIQLGDWGLDDILFVTATGDTLRKQTYSYWESKNNGTYDMGMGQTLTNGDFEKWGEPAAGTVVDSTYYDGWGWSYTYVYTMEISPVSAPAPISINTIAEESISVYPNPSAGSIVVKSTGSDNAAILYDMRGSVVATYAIENAETRIDLGNIPNGIYLIRLGTHSTKLVVRH